MVENCKNMKTGIILGDSCVAGICGELNGTITYCQNYANIKANVATCGGICAYAKRNSYVRIVSNGNFGDIEGGNHIRWNYGKCWTDRVIF